MPGDKWTYIDPDRRHLFRRLRDGTYEPISEEVDAYLAARGALKMSDGGHKFGDNGCERCGMSEETWEDKKIPCRGVKRPRFIEDRPVTEDDAEKK